MSHPHLRLLDTEAFPQTQSPLFNKLPGEIRSYIFGLAFTDYPDPSPDRQYEPEAFYTRPSYSAPLRADRELLRTCRAIYQECWHLPFIKTEQVYWVTRPDRAPPEFDGRGLGRHVWKIHQIHGHVEIDSLRIFAQMWLVENGTLAALLRTPHLHARTMTLTIRHTDWWYWENDQPLYFETSWLSQFCEAMSNSVREVYIELESVERKKQQIDAIAAQMAENWCLKRRDGTVFYADSTQGAAQVSRWIGSSSWNIPTCHGVETDPGRIAYYIAKVTFLPENVLRRRRGRISDAARETARCDYSNVAHLRLAMPGATRLEGMMLQG